MPDPPNGSRVSWEFLLKPVEQQSTRLIVRGRVSPYWLAAANEKNAAERGGQIFIERVYSLLARLPRPFMIGLASFGHGIMETRQLHGIKIRAEA